jgi:translation elongation factor EF-G
MVFAVNDDGVAPDDSKRQVGDVNVRIIVPEEFAGVAHHHLIARQGLITAMEAPERSVVIHASLPVVGYDGLVEAIATDTQGRGRVERE